MSLLMNALVFSLVSLLALQLCTADLCNWSGSGVSPWPGGGGGGGASSSPAVVDSRTVLQVRLRCTEGRVEWFYPGVHGALRVVLEPNLMSYANRHGAVVCVKPFRSGGGGGGAGLRMYVERAGELELLLMTEPEQVFCYRADGGPHRPAIYLQASPPAESDVSRRVVGFRYELLGTNSSSMSPPAASHLLLLGGTGALNTECRPCSDEELLLAICYSHFVVRGYIKSISHDRRQQTSFVEVSGGRVYRQRSSTFEREEEGKEEIDEEAMAAAGSRRSRHGHPGLPPESPSSWRGTVRALLQCGVKPGGGRFLFTGSEHFGEAWLGCAPRYKHFLSLYRTARAAGQTSCDFPLD